MPKFWEYTSPVKRYPKNPILSAKDVPYPVDSVFNAAVAKFEDRYVMLFRSELYHGRSSLGLAWSEDGVKWRAESRPFICPSEVQPWRERECLEIMDPRITRMGDTYYICYCGTGVEGGAVIIGRTYDFKSFERIAYPFFPHNRNACLLPEKVAGEFFLYHRPCGVPPESIWSSTSPDLELWHNHRRCMTPRSFTWDDIKIGAGPTPFKTDQGWLMLYHGVRNQAAGPIYRMGAALFDLQDPARLIGRSRQWLLQPQEPYEFLGNVGNVVFPCGAILEPDGTVKIYYGAADQCMCLAFCRLEELLETVRPPAPDDPELRGM